MKSKIILVTLVCNFCIDHQGTGAFGMPICLSNTSTRRDAIEEFYFPDVIQDDGQIIKVADRSQIINDKSDTLPDKVLGESTSNPNKVGSNEDSNSDEMTQLMDKAILRSVMHCDPGFVNVNEECMKKRRFWG